MTRSLLVSANATEPDPRPLTTSPLTTWSATFSDRVNGHTQTSDYEPPNQEELSGWPMPPTKLHNAHLAVVDQRKVSDYLLNPAHPDNGGKSKFFELLGYVRADTSPLVAALKTVAEAGEVVEWLESDHGQKYVVDGMLMSHTEQKLTRPIRTVWIIERSTDAPRLVTAYPREE